MSGGISFEKHKCKFSWRQTADIANQLGDVITPVARKEAWTIGSVIAGQTLLLAQTHLLAMGMEPQAAADLLGTDAGVQLVMEWVERQTLSIEQAVKSHLQKTN